MTTLEPISLSESKRLVELEAVIDDAKETFQKVARALVTIRDDKLYRAEHKTFAEYCAKRHGWAKSYGYNMAVCGEVIKQLDDKQYSAMAEKLNPRQARELAKAPAEKRIQVAEQATAKAAEESRPLTASDIKDARLEVCEDAPLPDEPPAESTVEPMSQPVPVQLESQLTAMHNKLYAVRFVELTEETIRDADLVQLGFARTEADIAAKQLAKAIQVKRVEMSNP